MPCEHYKDTLIEAAASRAQAQGELRAHLAGCAACRSAFEQEQSLLASIDAGLHVAANAEVPASLLPRVRARLDEEESAPRRIWATNWLVLASAAVMVVAFFTARAVWRTNVVQKPVETAGNTSVPSSRNHNTVVVRPAEKNSAPQGQFAISENRAAAHEMLVTAKSMPEVLVPRDQEVLLAEYAEQWRLHARAPLFAQDSGATILAPLQLAPIQIAELDVKLLAEETSQ